MCLFHSPLQRSYLKETPLRYDCMTHTHKRRKNFRKPHMNNVFSYKNRSVWGNLHKVLFILFIKQLREELK